MGVPTRRFRAVLARWSRATGGSNYGAPTARSYERAPYGRCGPRGTFPCYAGYRVTTTA